MEDLTFLVPIRGLNTSMSRLRHEIREEVLNNLIFDLLTRTLDILRIHSIPFIIVTADMSITPEEFDCRVIYDHGNDLNEALVQAIDDLDNSMIGLVMPDLPGFKTTTLDKIKAVYNLHGSLVASTSDSGTAIAVLKREYYKQKFFGPKSADRIISFAQSRNEAISKLEIQEIRRDLDTIEDYRFWYDSN